MFRPLFALGSIAAISIAAASPSCALDGAEEDGGKQVETARPAVVTQRENYIGVFTAPLSEPLAAQLSQVLAAGEGLLVTGVIPGSPAEKSGLRKDDVLARYSDRKLNSPSQLRRLILAEKPGQTVRLHVVRQAQRKTQRVTLGERTAVLPAEGGARRVIRFPGDRKLLNGRGIVIRRNTIGNAPAVKDKPAQPALGVLIASQDGGRYQVQVTYPDKDNKAAGKKLSGNYEEVRRQLDELPPDVRDSVKGSLARVVDRAGAKRESKFRCQLQPKIDGEKRQLRLRLEQPGRQKGSLRVLELDLGDGLRIEFDVEELLKSALLQQELRQLPPEVRRNVEATLRKTRIPQPTVEVRKSL